MKITVEFMYFLCNKYWWFSGGSDRQYSFLFDAVRSGYCVHELAIIIAVCTSGWTVKAIEEKIVSEYIARETILERVLNSEESKRLDSEKKEGWF